MLKSLLLMSYVSEPTFSKSHNFPTFSDQTNRKRKRRNKHEKVVIIMQKARSTQKSKTKAQLESTVVTLREKKNANSRWRIKHYR